MTALPDIALSIARRDAHNHGKIAATQRSGMKRPYPELERAYLDAVKLTAVLLEHIDGMNADPDAAVSHAAIYSEICRRAADVSGKRADSDAYVEARAAESKVTGEYLDRQARR